MGLALTVGFVVLGVIVVAGIAGYLIDRNAERNERKAPR
jgi:hypothetical protein